MVVDSFDRNLVVHHVRLVGQKQSRPAVVENPSKFHQQIIFTKPKNDQDRLRATNQVLARLASRAFRRPVDEQDLERLVSLAMQSQNDGDSFEASIQVALQAILISPKFLFRVEPPSAGHEFNQYRDLDEFELATRLSYFLWSSMPDDELLKLAWEGKLRAADNLQLQIKRMIQDKRAKRICTQLCRPMVNAAKAW